jgi:hypothetical protein
LPKCWGPNGAKKVADELEDVCARLTPFASRGLKEFGEFLAKAEQFDREGVISTGGKSPRKTPAVKSTDRLEEARARAKSLFDNALNPNLTVKAIEQQLAASPARPMCWPRSSSESSIARGCTIEHLRERATEVRRDGRGNRIRDQRGPFYPIG